MALPFVKGGGKQVETEPANQFRVARERLITETKYLHLSFSGLLPGYTNKLLEISQPVRKIFFSCFITTFLILLWLMKSFNFGSLTCFVIVCVRHGDLSRPGLAETTKQAVNIYRPLFLATKYTKYTKDFCNRSH